MSDAEDAGEGDAGEGQNAMFTASQRAYLRGEAEGYDRQTRQRMRARLGATVDDLGLALRGMERRDMRQVAQDVDVEDVDEAIAFLELFRRLAGGDRTGITVEHTGGDVEALEARLDRLEDGIRGLSEALAGVDGPVEDGDDGP